MAGLANVLVCWCSLLKRPWQPGPSRKWLCPTCGPCCVSSPPPPCHPPTLQHTPLAQTGEADEPGTIIIQSGDAADILPGQELTLDNNTSAAPRQALPAGHHWLHPCHCGSGPDCKGYVFPISEPCQ